MVQNLRASAEHALSRAPRARFASLPTPIERYEEHLPASAGELDLWIKRDDVSGTVYGGNKTRKLEFLLGAALAEGKSEVWTVGAIGSHHVLATALWSKHLSLSCRALHFPQPVTSHVLNNLRALSTTQPGLDLVGHKAQLPIEMFKTKLREWRRSNPDIYYIAGGGSSPVGVLGYVGAAFELIDQFEEANESLPDAIVVAAGTCGTLAGLQLGFALAGRAVRIIGVRVVDKVVANHPVACHLANRCAALLEKFGEAELLRLTHSDFEIWDGFIGDGYGVPSASALRGIQSMRAAEIKLEPTYTGKAFGALLDRASEFDGMRVLYWHTLSGVDLSHLIDQADVERDLPAAYMDYFREVEC